MKPVGYVSVDTWSGGGEFVEPLREMRKRAWERAEYHAKGNRDAASARSRAAFDVLGRAITALSTLQARPIPMTLECPKCERRHVDEGEWATRLHKTHQCQHCGHEWRPLPYPTVGVPAPTADGGAIAALEQTVRDLGEHRLTHVVWRDWLLKDPANAQINPHAGSAEFHDATIKDYDRHLANIHTAIAALSANPAPQADVARLWKFVEQAFDSSKISTSKRLLQDLGLPDDGPEMSLSWHINRYLAQPKEEG